MGDDGCLRVDEVGRVDTEEGGFNIHGIPGEMLAGHLGGEDAYTFVGEGGGICLAGAAVFKRDVIAREVLDVLYLDALVLGAQLRWEVYQDDP